MARPIHFRAQVRLSGVRFTPMRGAKPVGEPFDVDWVHIELRAHGVDSVHDESGDMVRVDNARVRARIAEPELRIAKKAQERQFLMRARAGSLRCGIETTRAVRELLSVALVVMGAGALVLGLSIPWGSPFPPLAVPRTNLGWTVSVLSLGVGALVLLVLFRSVMFWHRTFAPDAGKRISVEPSGIRVVRRNGDVFSALWKDLRPLNRRGQGVTLEHRDGTSVRFTVLPGRGWTLWDLACKHTPTDMVPDVKEAGLASLLVRPLLILALGHAAAAAIVWWLGASGSLPGMNWRGAAWVVLAMPLIFLPVGALQVLARRFERQRRPRTPTRRANTRQG